MDFSMENFDLIHKTCLLYILAAFSENRNIDKTEITYYRHLSQI